MPTLSPDHQQNDFLFQGTRDCPLSPNQSQAPPSESSTVDCSLHDNQRQKERKSSYHLHIVDAPTEYPDEDQHAAMAENPMGNMEKGRVRE